MVRVPIRSCAAGILLYSILAVAESAQAQSATPGDDSPRVEKITFRGVESIRPKVLRDSIVTQATRCRGLLLKPICAISQSDLWVETHDLDRMELRRDELRIRVIYFRHGYRQAQVSTSTAPKDDGVEVIFDVTEGQPTRIANLRVNQIDSVLSNRLVRRAQIPGEGDLLDLNRLDSARIRLRGMLWDRGYADAVVVDSLQIDNATHAAALTLHIDPRQRTTIEQVVVEGNEQVSDRTIQRILDLHSGNLYKRTDMTAAQRRLYQTELFRQTLVRVPEQDDSAKTVTVTVREAPFRAVRAGFGFNTTEFGQVEARFTRYNFMGGARRLDTRGAVGNLLAPQLYGKSIFGNAVPLGVGEDIPGVYLDPTWQLGADLTQPFSPISSRASLGISVSAHRRSIPGIVIDRGYAANASLTFRVIDRAPASLSYRFEQTRVEAGELYFCINFGVCSLETIATLREPHRLSPLWLTANVDRSDDPLAPTTGFTARLDMEHASAFTVSDFRYNRAVAEANRYMRMGRRGVLAGRIRGGWVNSLGSTADAVGIPPGDLGILHPRKRLYAGGARSVRGFGENQLGPRVLTIDPNLLIDAEEPGDTPLCTLQTIANGSCDPNVARSIDFVPRPLGGNTLIEASVEYRFPLTPTLTGSVFVDAGSVRGQRLNFPPGNRTAVSPGFGVRFRTPIGPARLDLGLRTGLAEELPVVTQVLDENGELRLVQLDTMKRYDPLEGARFLRKIADRLQLHLAIGEAF
jgi:outer membrane protein assembly factor BamA